MPCIRPWLPRSPFTRKAGLVVSTVLESNVFVVDGLLDPCEADGVVRWADAGPWTAATSRGPRRGEAERRHGRMATRDAEFARALWEQTGLADLVSDMLVPDDLRGAKAPSGLNEDVRVYSYSAGGDLFGKHVDEQVATPHGATEFTLLVYLTDVPEDAGGATVFYGGRRDAVELARVQPVKGRALLHRHGTRCLTHASAPMAPAPRSGAQPRKVVLRSDIAFA